MSPQVNPEAQKMSPKSTSGYKKTENHNYPNEVSQPIFQSLSGSSLCLSESFDLQPGIPADPVYLGLPGDLRYLGLPLHPSTPGDPG